MKMSNIYHVLLLFIASSSISAESVLSDQSLKAHPSPYVRMHANDAIKWQLWSKDVLQQARRENKLIFISVGFYACHWCHVMRDESFTDKEIAKIINANFIPVKIDRELNPALDNYLIDFVEKTRGYSGWPLNVFVTLDGYPLVGLVYLPADDFKSFIIKLNNRWKQDQQNLNALALNAFEFSRRTGGQEVKAPDNERLNKILMDMLRNTADELEGGIGGQAKFPDEPMLLALLELYKQAPNEWLKDFLILTLNQIQQKGLHDVIGGGFFRYTTDAGWREPHFEKMLYTNAGLIHVYLKAYELFKDDNYFNVAIETLEFLLTEMRADNGGFVSALNAQDELGNEGGSYLWQLDELKTQLTAQQWNTVNSQWQFIEMTEIDGVLPTGIAFGKEWRKIKTRLYKKRVDNKTVKDDKFLPSWNGYVLSALAKVIKASGKKHIVRKDFIKAGDQLFDLLKLEVDQGLKRTVAGISRRYLEDYAYVTQGLLDWAEVGKTASVDSLAKRLVKQALSLFAPNQAWKLSDDQLLPVPTDYIDIEDAQLLSSSVVILKLLRRLNLLEIAEIRGRVKVMEKRVDSRLMQAPVDFSSRIQYQLQYVD